MCWCYSCGTCSLSTTGGTEQSVYCFSLPRGHHFKMSCCGCEFLSAPTTTSCSVWRQIHWFPVSQWTCKGQFLYEKEGEENPLHFLSFCFFVLDLYNHFKMAPVLLCFVHERWFESYVGLNENEKRWFWVCQSVFGQKPETLQPLQCSCGLQA